MDDLLGHLALHAVTQILVLHYVCHVVIETVGDPMLDVSNVNLLLKT